MSTRPKVIYQGKEYIGKIILDITPEAMRDNFLESFANLSSFTFETENGFIVFGKTVIQEAIFLFKEA